MLIIIALGETVLPRWVAASGLVSAGLIATGLVPIVEPASLTNFGGFVLWCAWLLVVAVLLRRAPLPRQALDTRVTGAADARSYSPENA